MYSFSQLPKYIWYTGTSKKIKLYRDFFLVTYLKKWNFHILNSLHVKKNISKDFCQKTVRNRLREAHLHPRHPYRGLDLTAVRRRNRLEWENTHIRWRLALWRGVLFTDESRFSLYRADGRQRVWHHVGERFADVNVVDRVAHGGGGVMVWAGVSYGQLTLY